METFVQEPETPPLKAAKEQKKMSAEDVDIDENKHMGQIALRKLYHESPRPIVVLYTAPTCGPCRTLKPIIHGVADEFGDQVYLLCTSLFYGAFTVQSL